jgi:Cysteine-rich secretory protein family
VQDCRRWISALLVAAALAGLGLLTSPTSAAALTDPGTAAAQFLVKTNQTRAAAGLPPLVRDGGLDNMAVQWSNHMAGVYASNGGHIQDPAAPTDCNRSALCHRPDLGPALTAVDPGWRKGGENIGVGDDVDGIQNAFVSSPGHYANIVGDYDRVGIGVVTTSDHIWVTLDFMEAAAVSGYTGIDSAVPTGSGPAVANVTSLSARARFTPAQPQRILDTRSGGPLGGGGSLPLKVAGVGQVPGDAVGVVVNVTATGASGSGYLTVYPCGATPPTASNVNFGAGSSVPNLVTTALGTGGQLCVFSNVTTHVIVDLAGWYRAGAGTAFTPLSPQRVLDTRSGAIGQSYSLALGNLVSGDAVAVSVNLTATQAAGAGYLTAYPCGGAVPGVSNVNFAPGQTVPNSAVVPIGANRSICFFANTPTHVIVDLAGSFSGSGTGLTTVVPARLLDTRSGTGGWLGQLGHTQTIDLPVGGKAGVPANASAVVLNVTATDASGPGYLTVYPCGGAVPLASNLNFTAGDTRANLVTVRLGTDGKVCFYSYGRTAVIADITGYLS